MAIRKVLVSQDLLDMRKNCILHPSLLGIKASNYNNGYWGVHNPNSPSGAKYTLHRLIWSKKNGEIPEGMLILHNCGIRSCLNIDHLRCGTHKENAQDKIKHGVSRYIMKGKLGGDIKIYEEICRKYKKRVYTKVMLAKEYGVKPASIQSLLNRYKGYWD